MKLQVTQENLAKALNTVARVANSRNSLPILSNILIRTVDNRVSISATNLDIAITHFIGSKVEDEGSITVPARLTQDFISSLPPSILNISLDDSKLHITTDQYKSTINGISSEDFPVMPAIKNGTTWNVQAKDLKKALQQVAFAASNDDARPVLTGVYFFSDGTNLSIVATDSYRLAELKADKLDKKVDLLVPATAIQDLLRILSDGDYEVKVTHDDQQVQFEVDDITLVSRLIDGKYPDYKKLIPSKFTVTAKLSREDFMNITKVSSLFARESAGSITLFVDDKNSEVSIKSIASQLGENTAKATAEVTGSGEVTLNSRYLMDGLHAFSSDVVEFCFNGKLEPCIIRSSEDKSYMHLIMPLRS